MGLTELWTMLEHAIRNYTGLSLATFFMAVAVAVAFYYLVSSYFEPTPVLRKRETEIETVEPLPSPTQLEEITEEDIICYDGYDLKKPLLMGIKGLDLRCNAEQRDWPFVLLRPRRGIDHPLASCRARFHKLFFHVLHRPQPFCSEGLVTCAALSPDILLRLQICSPSPQHNMIVLQDALFLMVIQF